MRHKMSTEKVNKRREIAQDILVRLSTGNILPSNTVIYNEWAIQRGDELCTVCACGAAMLSVMMIRGADRCVRKDTERMSEAVVRVLADVFDDVELAAIEYAYQWQYGATKMAFQHRDIRDPETHLLVSCPNLLSETDERSLRENFPDEYRRFPGDVETRKESGERMQKIWSEIAKYPDRPVLEVLQNVMWGGPIEEDELWIRTLSLQS